VGHENLTHVESMTNVCEYVDDNH